MKDLISSFVLLGALGCACAIISSSYKKADNAGAQTVFSSEAIKDKDKAPANFTEFLEEIKRKKIKVSIGRRGGRGKARLDWACDRVISLPHQIRSSMRLSSFYKKYTHAYGIPIISSNSVVDAALKRACYIVRFLFADRIDIRNSFYNYYGRAGVIAESEGTTSIPEHSFLPSWWNQRARGLGATPQIPISTGGEENLLCRRTDRYRNQDIFMHEFAHGVHLVGAEIAIPGFKTRLDSAFRYGRRLWANTYAATDYREYFAQGVNSFFNTQAESIPPNGIHNHVNTRSELAKHDPTLYKILEDVFPCKNTVLDRCNKGGSAPSIRMHCDGKGPKTQAPKPTQPPRPPTRGPPTRGPRPPTRGPRPPTSCTDEWTLSWCTWRNKWACSRDCAKNFCKKTCGLCPPVPPTPPPLPPTIPRPPTRPPTQCKDLHNFKDCSYWASIGECGKNPKWMLVNCKKSCRNC